MVTVGSLDPYWKHKQLQRMGDAVAGAINFANDAKEKKRAKVRTEFENALKLGSADPEAGMLAINELENRYKDKLLDKSVPERGAYRSLMAKQIEEGEPMEEAWAKFSKAMLEKKADLTKLEEELAQTPQVAPLDPTTTPPEQYMEAMMSFAQGNPNAMQQENPEYTRKAQLLQKMQDPDYASQAAYGDLSGVERIYMQKWVNEQGLDADRVIGLATAPAETVSKADQAKQDWKIDLAETRGGEARETAQLQSDLRLAEQADRSKQAIKLENLRQEGRRETAGAGGAAGAAGATAAEGDDRASWTDKVYAKYKGDITKRKVGLSPGVQDALESGVQEWAFLENTAGDPEAMEGMFDFAMEEYIEAYRNLERDNADLSADELGRLAVQEVFRRE